MSECLTLEQLAILARVGNHDTRMMAREIVERRAADLTAEDREALREILFVVSPSDHGMPGLVSSRALAALTRLLNGGK